MKPVFFRSKRYTGKAYLSFHPLSETFLYDTLQEIGLMHCHLLVCRELNFGICRAKCFVLFLCNTIFIMRWFGPVFSAVTENILFAFLTLPPCSEFWPENCENFAFKYFLSSDVDGKWTVIFLEDFWKNKSTVATFPWFHIYCRNFIRFRSVITEKTGTKVSRWVKVGIQRVSIIARSWYMRIQHYCLRSEVPELNFTICQTKCVSLQWKFLSFGVYQFSWPWLHEMSSFTCQSVPGLSIFATVLWILPVAS